MSEHIYKSHSKTLLIYHLVFPVKYRCSIIGEEIENTLREVCIGIEERYDIHFLEVGMEADHVHFLVQGVPCMAVSRIVTILKSIT